MIRAVSGLTVLTRVVFAQATAPATPHVSFEVASIKPVGPINPNAVLSGMDPGMSISADRLSIGSMSLLDLVCQAYKLSRNRIVGGPDWLSRQDVERFAIVAKMPNGAATRQVPEMLQALLADRFQLVAHGERRDIPVYALVVAKDGAALEEAIPATPISPPGKAPPSGGDAPSSEPASAPGGERSFAGGGVRGTAKRTTGGMAFSSQGFRRVVNERGQVRFEYDSLTMEGLAASISQFMDRPVIDQTGLTGSYRVSYEIDLKAMAVAMIDKHLASMGKGVDPAELGDPLSDPFDAIFSSVKKLGLKLERRVLPCDVLVIEHVERDPTEN